MRAVGDREQLDAARLGLGTHDGVGRAVELDASLDEVVERAHRVLVGDLHHVETRGLEVAREDDVGDGGDARPVEFSGLVLGLCEQLLQRVDVHRRRNRHRYHGIGDARDRQQVFRVVGELLERVRHDFHLALFVLHGGRRHVSRRHRSPHR